VVFEGYWNDRSRMVGQDEVYNFSERSDGEDSRKAEDE
jgi:hypothetical protein